MTTTFKSKQIIAIRKDLHMSVGKLVSQACHACLEASEASRKYNLKLWKEWRMEGAKKVIVKVLSLNELLSLEKKVKRLDIPHTLIIDKGLTQLAPNTPTALGIGPTETTIVDKISGNLKLL
jgi:PTH2 family peptidyl-tRNA hydrolase